SYTYNADGWMLSWKDSTTGIGEDYTYDSVGNVASIAGYKSGQVATYFTNTYTYDAANRVTQRSTSAHANFADKYTYDDFGRRASWQHSDDGVNSTTVNYTYDAADRLTQAAGGSTIKWTYDKVGNVTSVQDGSVVFTTDAAGNPNGVSSGRAQNTHYTYTLY